MKYIMFEDQTGRRTPIIFPNNLVHIQVAVAVSPLIPFGRIVSAGEAVVRVRHCGGESTTLQASANDEDATTINEMDYFFGHPNLTGIPIP